MAMRRPITTRPHRQPWPMRWVGLWALVAPLSMAQPVLPSLGDEQGMSIAAERRLGDSIAQSIYRDPDYIDDPVLGDYLQLLWTPLFKAAQVRGDIGPELAERFAWELVISRDKRINAFALPGGYMGVNLGLIAATDSAPEIASVMAHELSHVSQRHIARLIARQDQQSPWLLGTMILGVLAASASANVDVANAVILGGQAAAVQSQLGFSRDMEREADRIGFAILDQAGLDGQGFVTMFSKLHQASRLNDTGAFPYLRSHPLSDERMADMRSRLPAVPVVPTWVAPQGLHAVMAARAAVLAESSPERWQDWVSLGQQPRADAAMRVRAILGAHRLGQHANAVRGARGLAQDWAGTPLAFVANNLLVEVLMAPAWVPDAQTAADLAAHAQRASTHTDRATVLWGVQSQMALRQWSLASERLRAWVVQYPRDALAWQLLSQVQWQQGQRVAALRAEAESRVAIMDFQGGLDRLQAAKALTGAQDEWEQTIVETRWRQVTERLKELQREC
jgi:predicted Zn-dependent protease